MSDVEKETVKFETIKRKKCKIVIVKIDIAKPKGSFSFLFLQSYVQ